MKNSIFTGKDNKKNISLHNAKTKSRITRALSLSMCMVMLLVSVSLCGCASQSGSASDQAGKPSGLTVYYITPDIDSLIPVAATTSKDEHSDRGDLMNALIAELQESPDKPAMKAPLSEESGYIAAMIKDDQAVLDFDEKLGNADVLYRTLVMASVTRTLTQIDGIATVSITINGSPALDSSGMVIGALTADSFIDNAGLQINAEEKTQLTLYFANETGDGLVKTNRMVVYSGNIPMDKLVVMQLLAGPLDNENGYPVMNPATKIINVTTQDGTCYVNLDSSFLSPVDNISNDVAIYSIVDSLIELGSVNKVQFLIDSDSDVMFREAVSLNTVFDRNLDIVIE